LIPSYQIAVLAKSKVMWQHFRPASFAMNIARSADARRACGIATDPPPRANAVAAPNLIVTVPLVVAPGGTSKASLQFRHAGNGIGDGGSGGADPPSFEGTNLR